MDDSTQLTENDQATELASTEEPGAHRLNSDVPVSSLIPAQRGETTPRAVMLRDRNGRFVRRIQAEPLPDFVACLSAVPGGLGVELPVTFDFAGVQWTPADAAFDGSPIGFRLAVELAHLTEGASPEESAEDAPADLPPTSPEQSLAAG